MNKIFHREENYLERGYSEFDNILQGKYCTIYIKLLLGEKEYTQEKRGNML